MNGPNVILILKIAVLGVSVILASSIVALLRGRYRLHGQLNLVFMILTLAAVLALEAIVRLYDPKMFDYLFREPIRRIMIIHLCFAIPSAILLPVMYFTGRTGRRWVHRSLAAVFATCWIGTLITGVFFLPHTAP
jgi:uncharacterized membrane protein YozB (DUF420 family)